MMVSSIPDQDLDSIPPSKIVHALSDRSADPSSGAALTMPMFSGERDISSKLQSKPWSCAATSLTASSSPVQSGKAHFLAVINPTRAAALPELQTARELGHPELEIDGLAGIFAGTMMSTELRERIAADVAAVCQEPEARRKLEAAGHNVL